MERKVTLFDLADALGVSTGTVHRALHNHTGVSPLTKTRVVQMATSMGYRPNLAARYLSRRKQLRISRGTSAVRVCVTMPKRRPKLAWNAMDALGTT